MQWEQLKKKKKFMACNFLLQIKRTLLNSMNNIYSYNQEELFYLIENVTKKLVLLFNNKN